MDPEDVRTIVTAASTIVVGLVVGTVPAILLYKQNKHSAKLAADERREQRKEEAARLAAESA